MKNPFRTNTAADIAGEIEKIEADTPNRRQAITDAELALRQAIIDNDPATIAKAERASSEAKKVAEYAAIRLSAMRDDLARLSQAEAEADKRRAYDVAMKSRAAILKDHPPVLRQMERDAERLIAETENVQALIQRVNENLPAGAKPIPDPELEMRGRFPEPEKIVSQTVVDRWCHAGTMRQIPDDLVPLVTVKDGSSDRGAIYQRGSGSVDVERRQFRVIRYLPSQTVEWPTPLAAALRIPILTADEPERTRAIQERWEVITAPAADAA